MSADNIEIIRKLYHAFLTRNIPYMLEVFSQDMEWSVPVVEGIPWGGDYKGHAGVMTFFKNLTSYVEATVDPDQLFKASGDIVVAVGHSGGRVRGGSGKEFRLPAVHIWTLKDGKIIKGQGYFDTVQMRGVIEREGWPKPTAPNGSGGPPLK